MAESLTVFCLILIYLVISSIAKRECETGKFGWKCRFNCNCVNNEPCDPVTGACPTGCQPGKYGQNCQFDNKCLYDRQGVNYTGIVNQVADNTSCLDWLDPELAGYKDLISAEIFPDKLLNHNYCRNPGVKSFAAKPWCYYKKDGEVDTSICDELNVCECPDYLYGDSCLHECHCSNIEEVCDKFIGKCQSHCAPGWTGTFCEKSCIDGYYGDRCSKECGQCYNDNCHHESGKCLEDCVAGYYGDKCKKECPDGSFGRNCIGLCGNCGDNDPCNHVTGSCFTSCAAGYRNQTGGCKDVCPENYYGVMCKEPCGVCRQGFTCNHVTGACENGCEAGYFGTHCNKTCEVGWYGENCTSICGNCKLGVPCHRVTGQCLEGCAEGFVGYRCAKALQKSVKSSVVGGGIAAVVVFLIILILIVLLLRKRRRKRLAVSKPFSKDGCQEEELQTHGGTETCQLLEDSRIGNLLLKAKCLNMMTSYKA